MGAAFVTNVPSRIAMFDNSRVRYQSYGKGPKAVVLVHGWISDGSFWSRNIPALAAERRVLTLDLPGHGGSDAPKVDYTPQFFAKALDSVLLDAKVSRAVLVGHNMGAPIVRQYLADHAAKVAGLILVDPAITKPAGPEEMGQRNARRAPFLDSLRSPNYSEVAGKFIDRMFVPETPEALRAEIKAKMLAVPQWTSVSSMEGTSDGSMWAPQSGAPTLAIFSDKGRRAENEAMLNEMFSFVDHQEWSGCGNFTMMEKPKEFDASAIAFLTKIGF